MRVVGDDKAALRRRLLTERNALSSAWRETASQAVWRHLLAWRAPAAGEAWGSYATLGSEVLTAGLAVEVRRAGAKVLYPRCDASAKRLSYGEVRDEAELSVGTFGVLEPADAPVPLSELDVVLVPGLAFDQRGARLGYGGGYYDRTLPGCRGLVIGLAFAFQVQTQLPTLAHDQRVQALVTEQGVTAWQ